MKGFLITECNQDLQINEGADKTLYVEGIFSSWGLRNANGRVYEEAIMKREVTKIQEKIERQCLWGELGHPPNPEVNPDKIAIRVESLKWNGKDLVGKAKILGTPQGEIAKTLVKEGRIGISSRGLGTVSEDGTVNEDYQLLTWDLVTEPSNGPSWVKGIYEGKSWELGSKFANADEDEVKATVHTIEEAQEAHFKNVKQMLEKIKKNL